MDNAASGRIAALDKLLSLHSEHEIAEAIEVLVDVLDLVHGDPDDEPGGDDEPVEANGDTLDCSWTEWDSRGRQRDNPGISREFGGLLHEDAEDDDADACLAADDQGSAGGRWFDCDGLPGDAADAEDGHDREEDRG